MPLPYELIGRITVIVLAIIVCLVGVFALFVVLYAIWYRGLTWVINRSWAGYDVQTGPNPPPRRRKIAVWAKALRDREFDKIQHYNEELKARDKPNETAEDPSSE